MPDTTDTGPPLADDGAAYTKAPGWDSMTHEERYAALQAAPKPESKEARNALLHAKQAVLYDQNAERKALRQGRDAAILAAKAPCFKLTISAPATLSLSQPTYPIRATLIHASEPPDDGRTVLFRPTHGPLSPDAVDMANLYSVYTDSTCTPLTRISHIRPNASMRPAREADGSFTKEAEVDSWDGWEELDVGDEVVRTVELGLDERSGWREHLDRGKKYWIRCDGAGLFGEEKVGLDRHWLYGRKCDFELPMKIKLRDPEAIAISLDASNSVEFDVIE